MSMCIVCEGGAMRGNFTSGVLDVIMEERLPRADTIVGVSAGSLNAVSYCSRQIGRSVRINTTYCHDWRYLSMRSYMLTGDALGTDFMFHRIQDEYDPFDYGTWEADPTHFIAVATNVDTGEAEYEEVEELPRDVDLIRASASMPLVSRIVEMRGKRLLDGGTADSIPVQWALDQGFDRIVVILTQDRGYRKKPLATMGLVRRTYLNQEAFCEQLATRHTRYNICRDFCFDLEREKRIFVITPAEPVTIGQMETDPAKVMALYNEGRAVTKAALPELRSYLGV